MTQFTNYDLIISNHNSFNMIILSHPLERVTMRLSNFTYIFNMIFFMSIWFHPIYGLTISNHITLNTIIISCIYEESRHNGEKSFFFPHFHKISNYGYVRDFWKLGNIFCTSPTLKWYCSLRRRKENERSKWVWIERRGGVVVFVWYDIFTIYRRF